MPNPLQNILALLILLACTFLAERGQADEMSVQVTSRATREAKIRSGETSSIGVTLDFAKILAFDHPARTIVIGNPSIVDGTLSDDRTIVLTGKALGTTNMIVLGEGGLEIANLTVHVAANTSQWTTVHEGTKQQIFSCSGPCRQFTAPSAAK